MAFGNQVGELVIRLSGKTDQMARSMKRLDRSLTGVRGTLKNLVTTTIGFGAAMLGIRGASQVFRSLTAGIFGTNAALEKANIQFEVLTGSVDIAEKHVKSLFEFAARTPFEVRPIIDASKFLTNFMGVLGRSEDTLRLVGDAAGAMNQQISEVAMWYGRAYAAIQSGEPFGRATRRLMQMGILTGKARVEMKKLFDAKADGSKILDVLNNDFLRLSGSMIKLAGTWEGLTTTLKDNINLTLSQGFKPLFETTKIGFEVMIKMVRENKSEITAWATELSSSMIGTLKDVTLGTAGILDTIMPILDDVSSVVKELWSGYQLLPTWVQEVGILGALMGGKLGLAAITAAAAAAKGAAVFGSTSEQADIDREYYGMFGPGQAPGPLLRARDAARKKRTEQGRYGLGPEFDADMGALEAALFPGQVQVPAPAKKERVSLKDRLNKFWDAFDQRMENGPGLVTTLPKPKAPGFEEEAIVGPMIDPELLEARTKAAESAAKDAARIWKQTRTPIENYYQTVARLNELLEEGFINQDTHLRAVDAAWETLSEKSEKTTDDMKNGFTDLLKAIEGWGREVEDVFVRAAETGKFSFSSLWKSIQAGLIRAGVQKLITGPGGLLGGLFSAKGNVFSGGRALAFASGGIIDSLTAFPMANGGVGIAGEAGPEAIMPLRRGKDGRLGVDATAGGGTGANNYYITAIDAASFVEFLNRPQNARAVQGVISTGISGNAPIRRSVMTGR